MSDLEASGAAYKWLTRSSVNLDITNKCTLACSKCTREHLAVNWGLANHNFPGQQMTLETYQKYLNKFDEISFCGQVSDPMMHPEFNKFLHLAADQHKSVRVHTAINHRPLSFFRLCWEAHTEANWTFGIDGLPKDSHKYRTNQNGQKMFDIMVESTKYLKKVYWQYIVFRYNENDIDEAKELADKHNINLRLIGSGRFDKNDPLEPTKHKVYRPEWKNKL